VPRAGHYHVLVGLCGMYMPDENHVFETRKEAEAGARAIAERAEEDGERVVGSPRLGYQIGNRHCIEVVPCDDAECTADLDAS
jgi:hypothetical protein